MPPRNRIPSILELGRRTDLGQEVQGALNVLRGLQGPHNPNFLGQLIEVLLMDTPKTLAQIESSLRTGDSAAVQRAAHSLKSNFASFGAKSTADHCAELEKSASGISMHEGLRLLSRIRADFQEIKDVLKRNIPS